MFLFWILQRSLRTSLDPRDQISLQRTVLTQKQIIQAVSWSQMFRVPASSCWILHRTEDASVSCRFVKQPWCTFFFLLFGAGITSFYSRCLHGVQLQRMLFFIILDGVMDCCCSGPVTPTDDKHRNYTSVVQGGKQVGDIDLPWADAAQDASLSPCILPGGFCWSVNATSFPPSCEGWRHEEGRRVRLLKQLLHHNGSALTASSGNLPVFASVNTSVLLNKLNPVSFQTACSIWAKESPAALNRSTVCVVALPQGTAEELMRCQQRCHVFIHSVFPKKKKKSNSFTEEMMYYTKKNLVSGGLTPTPS